MRCAKCRLTYVESPGCLAIGEGGLAHTTPAYLAAKAAIPRRPVVHKHPSAPVTDVTGARARIDTEQEEPQP